MTVHMGRRPDRASGARRLAGAAGLAAAAAAAAGLAGDAETAPESPSEEEAPPQEQRQPPPRPPSSWFSGSKAEKLGDAVETVAETASEVSGLSDLFSGDCCLAEAASGIGSPDCFVATASLRSEDHPDLNSLRALRDRVLAKSGPGLLFIRLYYRWGAYGAAFIRHRPLARLVVRETVVRPAARLSRRLLGA